jgi:hypothetical protein
VDPGLSGLAFCLFRCDIPEGGMKPLTTVVSFDVGEQVTEHGCRGSPRQKSRPRSSTKRGPFLRASLRTKWKRMQRFCQVTRECPVKFPRREGHLFLPVEDGPARVGRSTLRAPRLRAQAQQRERSKPEIAAGRSVRRRRVRARRAHGRELHFELARNVKARFVAPISVICGIGRSNL